MSLKRQEDSVMKDPLIQVNNLGCTNKYLCKYLKDTCWELYIKGTSIMPLSSVLYDRWVNRDTQSLLSAASFATLRSFLVSFQYRLEGKTTSVVCEIG